MAPAELKRKMESLLGSFRRERHREKKSRESATLGNVLLLLTHYVCQSLKFSLNS